jgi:hypothetical protein
MILHSILAFIGTQKFLQESCNDFIATSSVSVVNKENAYVPRKSKKGALLLKRFKHYTRRLHATHMFQITQAKHSMGLKPTSAMPVWHNKFH